MTARTHDLAAITALGFAALGSSLQTVTLSTALVAILANQAGAIMPDIDQPTAPLWRALPTGGLLGRLVDKMLGGHRFLSHSLLGLALFGFLSRLFLQALQPLLHHVDVQLIWYAFLIGFVSHLVMDTLTKEGVPWFLPFPVKIGLPPSRRLRITTGKGMETLVIFPALVIVDVYLCATHYDQIATFIQQHLIR